MFINRGGDIIAGDGTVMGRGEGVYSHKTGEQGLEVFVAGNTKGSL